MELEGCQEVVLLKDVLITSQKQNLRFDDQKMASECASMVKEVAADVDMMLSLDGMSDSDKRKAQKTMHLLLFSKTMLSSGDIDETQRDCYNHACSSLPDIGWPTYIAIIQACDWLEFATESWKNHLWSTRTRILQEILRCLNDPKAISVWDVAVRQLIDCLSFNEGRQELDLNSTLSYTEALVRSALTTESDNSDKIKFSVVAKVLDVLGYFSAKKQQRLLALTDNTSCTVFRILLLCSEQLLHSFSHTDVQRQLEAHVDYNPIVQTISNMSPPLEINLFTEWQKIIKRVGTKEYSREETINMDVDVVSSHTGQYLDALDRLLGEFQCSADSTIGECFLRNAELLQPHHINKLLPKVGQYSEKKGCVQLQQVIYKAFSDWPLEAQDAFREECHRLHGFRDDVFIDTQDVSQHLVKTINKLSTIDENEVAKEISLLCLQSPMKTLTQLFNHAILSGQIGTVVKILSRLKRSCGFRSAEVSFATALIKKQVLNETLSSLQFTNLLLFTKALIQIDILQSSELVTRCILFLLSPSKTGCRALRLLQVVLNCGDAERANAFTVTRPSLVLLEISRILHHCMTTQQDLNCNILNLKEEILVTQSLILNWIANNPHCIQGHEICWLWKRHEEFGDVTLCYLKDLLNSCGLIHLYTEKVKHLPLTTLLLFCSVSLGYEDAATKRVCLDCHKLGWSKACFPVKMAVSKILARLTADEVQRLLEKIGLLVESYEDHCRLVASITVLTDSLVILNCNHPSISDLHLEQVTQMCTASIKNTLLSHQPFPLIALSHLICILCCMMTNLREPLQRIVTVLILDLCAQVRLDQDEENHSCYTTIMLKAVDQLNDANLMTQAKRIFERCT